MQYLSTQISAYYKKTYCFQYRISSNVTPLKLQKLEKAYNHFCRAPVDNLCVHLHEKQNGAIQLVKCHSACYILPMKNFATLLLRFLIAFVISILCISSVFMTNTLLEHGTDHFWETLYGICLATVPIAVIVAAFMTFFMLNRTTSSRFRGYVTLMLLTSLALFGSASVIRFVALPAKESITALPQEYRLIGSWMTEVAKSPWPEFVAGLTSFALFSATAWGLTRLSRSRPLLGAFLAPSGALAALYLFSLYLSGPADALFTLVGFNIPRLMTAAILTGSSALALLLLDVLIARKPAGGRRDA